MEEVIYNALEKSLVGGAFIYLLYYFTRFHTKILEDITKALGRLGETLVDISGTLSKLDMRMENMEQRIKRLEEK